MDEFFPNDEELEESDRTRLDAEWIALSALREVFRIAHKGIESPTYAQVMVFARSLLPDLFQDDRSLIAKNQESLRAREFKEVAESRSEVESRSVTPLQAVEDEINKYENWLQTSGNKSLLMNRLSEYYRIRDELRLKSITEQQVIVGDVFQVDRNLPISGQGHAYQEYKLPDKRRLRVRMLHPDRPEHLTGTDVIYENYWDRKNLVRVAALQYKIWDKKRLYSDERFAKQLERMKKTFCQNCLCDTPKDQPERRYRLPFCSAFLRPTDKLQYASSRLVSSGYHIPICVVERSWKDTERGGKQIISKDIRSEAVTHRLFEELFTTNMLGSKWLTFKELEDLYRSNEILTADDRLVIHAQEYAP